MENFRFELDDVKILVGLKTDKGRQRYVFALAVYLGALDFITNVIKFIFITLPTVILFPIWGLAFDLYRLVMRRKLRDLQLDSEFSFGNITLEKVDTDGEQTEDKGN